MCLEQSLLLSQRFPIGSLEAMDIQVCCVRKPLSTRRSIIIVCLSVLLLLLSALSRICADDSFRLPIQEFTLDNGLKILIVEYPKSSRIATEIVYKVGSVNEPCGLTGIAHLLEHMMFKGTKTIGTRDYDSEIPLMEQIDEIAEAIGRQSRKDRGKKSQVIRDLESRLASLQREHNRLIVQDEFLAIYANNDIAGVNASTSADYTRLYASIPSDRLELWCRLESDRMREPVFRGFYRERDVVVKERRRVFEDDLEGALREQLICTAFVAHPYQRPVIGWTSDIQSIARSDLRDFWNRYYSPNNCAIILVGDIDPVTAVPIIKRYFGDIPSRPLPPPVQTIEPEQRGERIVRIESDQKPLAYVAYHKPAIGHPDQYVADILQELLAGGESSRLYNKMVVEEGIAERVNAWGGPDKYPGLFIFALFPQSSHTVSDLIASLDEEFEILAKKPVNQSELRDAKERLRIDFFQILDSSEKTAAEIAKYEGMDDWRYINTLVERREAITVSDIQEFVKRYFVSSNRTVAKIVRPRD